MKANSLYFKIKLTFIGFALPALILLPVCLRLLAINLTVISLSTVALAGIFLFSYLLLSIHIENKLNTFSNLLHAVIEGDFSQRLRVQNSDLFSSLAVTINDLVEQAGFHHLTDKTNNLLLQKIVSNIDVAIIASDGDGKITLANPEANKLFAYSPSIVGQTTESLGLVQLFKQNKQAVLEFQFPAQAGRWQLYLDSYFEQGKRFQIYFISDVSHLLRDEELKAWKNLLRVLSHEINNSLTPIASISQSLQYDLDKNHDQDMLEGLTLIAERAKSLEQFVKSYRQFTHLPKPDKQPVDVNAVIANCINLIGDPRIEFNSLQDISLSLDSTLVEQVIINLLKNGLEACTVETGEVRVTCRVAKRLFIISIADNGCGISNRDNLFVPFYSTKQLGSGIGLVFSRQIIEAHGGHLTLENNQGKAGACATISLSLL